jgi:PAS domain S-box-containing protein
MKDKFYTNHIYYKHLLSIIMEWLITTRFSKSTELSLYHTYFIFFELELSSKAINQMLRLKKNARTFFEKQSLNRLEKEISESLLTRNNSSTIHASDNLDIKKLIDLESRFNTLEHTMMDSVKSYSKLIKEIDHDQVSLKQIKLYMNDFSASVERVKYLFSQGGSNNNPRTISSFICFQLAILQNPEEAKRWSKTLQRKVDQMSHLRRQDKIFFDEELMYDEESTLIQVGALKENLGRIINPNKGIERLFGYRRGQLIGKNINLVIPSDLAIIHQAFLETYIRTGKNKILYKEQHLYGIHKNGNLVQIGLSVRPMLNYIENVFLFIAYIQKRDHPDSNVMLVNGYGEIISADDRIDSVLGLRDYYKLRIPIQCYSKNMLRYFNKLMRERHVEETETIAFENTQTLGNGTRMYESVELTLGRILARQSPSVLVQTFLILTSLAI